MSDYLKFAEEVSCDIDPVLRAVFDDVSGDDITVKAGLYSLLAGGKRFRPTLMYMSADLLGIDRAMVRSYACALEMIHTYSLIHDDLPGMDNDDLRRGKPTCHVAFGEGIAVLAGDMLLNRAFEILTAEIIRSDAQQMKNAAVAANRMAYYSGIRGMLGGQSIDKSSEGKELSLDQLAVLQELKTGALIEAAITMPYYLRRGDDQTDLLLQLKKLAGHIGLAFQIKDDLLDVTSSPEVLGKSIGKDDRDDKSTFVTMLGVTEAKNRLDSEIDGCIAILDTLGKEGYDTYPLRSMIAFIAERDY